MQNPRLIPQTDEKSALFELRARSSQENPEAGRALAAQSQSGFAARGRTVTSGAESVTLPARRA